MKVVPDMVELSLRASNQALQVLNLYNKGFGGPGFKMTSEILNFHDMAYAAFEIK